MCHLKSAPTIGQSRYVGNTNGAIVQVSGVLIPQLWLLHARDTLLPNEVCQSRLCSEHFLSIFQLKLSQLEQPNSREINPCAAPRAVYCIIACVQMTCNKRHAGAQYDVLSVLRRNAQDGVEMLEVKGEAFLSCCAFSDDLDRRVRWCVNM